MALAVRRPSDWSVVLRTAAGQIIRFDRSNLRLQTTQQRRESTIAEARPEKCPSCQQYLPSAMPAQYFTTGDTDSGMNDKAAGVPTYVHPEYFGLLATCLEEEQVLETDDEDDHLSKESFNQGYSERFFVEEELLGKGGKAEVIKVRHVLEGVDLGIFALKRVPVGDSQSWLIKTLREVQSLRFKHANLVSYNHVWLEQRQRKYSPKVPVLHILQEYCDGGDLEAFVYKACGKTEPTVEQLKQRSRRKSRGDESPKEAPSGLSIDMVYSFFKDILAGLSYLHEQGLIHRDMKASNCLLDYQARSSSGLPRILVSDFGEAQLVTSKDKRSGSTGTLAYTAPEVIRGEVWTAAADMFSLGMILYFLTHEGTLPYHSLDDDYDGLRAEISTFAGYSLFSGRSSLNEGDKRELESVLSDLLSPDPADRPSCTDLLAKMQLHDRKSHSHSRPKMSLRKTSSFDDAQEIPHRPDMQEQGALPTTEKMMILPSNTADTLDPSPPKATRVSLQPWSMFMGPGSAEAMALLVFLIRLRLVETMSVFLVPRYYSVFGIFMLSVLEGRLMVAVSTRLALTTIIFLLLYIQLAFYHS